MDPGTAPDRRSRRIAGRVTTDDGRPAANGAATQAIGPGKTSTKAEVTAGVREYIADLRRRRAASLRLPPLECGHRDPLDCSADKPAPRLHCDQCLTFDVGERERLATCWESERCPLAGALVGGDR